MFSINYNIYLQASALDYNDGLDQDQLVKFYKKLGFVRGGCKDETWLIYVVNDNYWMIFFKKNVKLSLDWKKYSTFAK